MSDEIQTINAASTTTSEQDRKTASHRHINLMWERTQQIIAVWVSFIVTMVCSYMIVFGDPALQTSAFLF